MTSNNSSRNSDPLAMQIYSALLGGVPKVVRRPSQPQSRLRVEVRVERLGTGTHSPFHTPGIKESIERAAAGAINALSEAGDRLRRARRAPSRAEQPADARPILTPTKPPTPIVLVGPSAVRHTQSPPRRSAAA